MSKNRSRRYSREERAELLELYRQSGLSHWKFCQEMDVGYDTFRRWLRPDGGGVNLVEVTPAESPSTGPVELSVRLPNGLVCELRGGLSREEALRWVRELRGC